MSLVIGPENGSKGGLEADCGKVGDREQSECATVISLNPSLEHIRPEKPPSAVSHQMVFLVVQYLCSPRNAYHKSGEVPCHDTSGHCD